MHVAVFWSNLQCSANVLTLAPPALPGAAPRRYDEFGRLKKQFRAGQDRKEREAAALARLHGTYGGIKSILLDESAVAAVAATSGAAGKPPRSPPPRESVPPLPPPPPAPSAGGRDRERDRDGRRDDRGGREERRDREDYGRDRDRDRDGRRDDRDRDRGRDDRDGRRDDRRGCVWWLTCGVWVVCLHVACKPCCNWLGPLVQECESTTGGTADSRLTMALLEHSSLDPLCMHHAAGDVVVVASVTVTATTVAECLEQVLHPLDCVATYGRLTRPSRSVFARC